MGENMQASTNLRKACHPHKSRIIFATEGFVSYRWDKQEGEDQRNPQYAPLKEILTTQDRSGTRRTERTAGESSSRKHGEAAKRCSSKSREKKESEGRAPMELGNEARCHKDC